MSANDAGHKSAAEGLVVSVIVPARNEEACLGECLSSLVHQDASAEIIVVNDGSTDRTCDVAGEYPVKLIDADPLPVGWTGKSHAAFCGARLARGRWLLFTDADTIHRTHSLRRAIREAEEHDADLLSYSPKQIVHGLFERALMAVVFAELRREYPPRKVSDPDSPIAAANGQYLLIRREMYDRIGGHAAVRASLLEDVEIARLVKRAHGNIRFRYGRDAVKTRMYRSFPQMWEGWTKNLAVLFPRTINLAVLRSMQLLLSLGGLSLLVWGEIRSQHLVAALGVAVMALLSVDFFQRVRKAHFGWINTAIAPFGLPLFIILLLRSRLHYRRKQVSWKGRQYAPGAIDQSPQDEAVSSRTLTAK